ncbi:tyrosinase family oxidase copper chaperone [Streptomyces uncialis]|uniref:tyrosinase family oxidase copper chaperone n=1 Tax=Streptomyces uncialis TaxID=1048205 RepID=UPI00340F7D11
MPGTITAHRTRRTLLRTLFTGAVATATATALAPLLAATREPHRPRAPRAPAELLFEETYRGRRIEGRGPGTPTAARTRPVGHHGSGGPRVTIDGRPLPLMRRADGSYLSVVDHYVSYPSPLAAARAAVDELGPARLAPGTGARNV